MTIIERSVRLHDVYDWLGACDYLYMLLKQRSGERAAHINISHTKLPSFDEHKQFFERKPYRIWQLVIITVPEAHLQIEPHALCFDYEHLAHVPIGYVSATAHNEIGIILDEQWRGKGYGPVALQELIDTYQPLPEVPSVRRGEWIANIHPLNEPSKKVFTGLGFKIEQETYVLERGGSNGASQKEGGP